MAGGWRWLKYRSRLARCAVLILASTAIPTLLLMMIGDSYNHARRQWSEDMIQRETIELYPLEMPDRSAKMEELQQRMNERSLYLEQSCIDHRQELANMKASTWEYLINHQYHLIWCNVFKSASSSWFYNFNLLANYTHKFLDRSKKPLITLAREKYPRPTLEELLAAQKNGTTFIIVRHPFERLLSGYRDKIVNPLRNTLHWDLGNRIVRKYRHMAKNVPSNKRNPRYPSFSEFVSYVLDESNAEKPLDMHWVPYTTFCTPCKINFDIIMKFETLQDDQNYLISKTGLQHIIKPLWKNSGKGEKTTSQMDVYYSQLTKQQIKDLYNMYKYDFELFNYTLGNTLEMAREDKFIATDKGVEALPVRI